MFDPPRISLLSKHLPLPAVTHLSTYLTRWNLCLAGVFNHYENVLGSAKVVEKEAL